MSNARNAITGELGRIAVAGKLAEVGILSSPTPRNYPAADLVAYDGDAGVSSNPLFVQIKTIRGKQATFWLVGSIDKVRQTPDSLWWVFVDLRPEMKAGPRFFVVPGRKTKTFAKAPMRGNKFDGQASVKRTEIQKFGNNWVGIANAIRSTN